MERCMRRSSPPLSVTRTRLVGAILLAAAAAGGACSGSDATASDGGGAGLATVFDSANGDTIVARVAGEVPAERIRQLVEELRIQPGAEDTTLFTQAWSFVVAPDGRMIVPDDGASRIFIFDETGKLVRAIGRKGAGPGEFNQFNGTRVLPDGRLAVLDVGNARISFFSVTGELETSWRVPTGFYSNDQLRTDTSGTLRIALPLTEPGADKVIGRIGLVRVGADGALSDSLLPPDLGTNEGGYIARANGGSSQMYAMHSPREFWAWHPDGFFVAANGARSVIEVSRPGRPLRIVRDAPSIPIADDEIAWDRERITTSLRRNDPSWTWNGPPLPTTKSPIASLRVTMDGRIWVQVPTPSELIPETERDEQRPGAPPVARYRSRSVYEVYQPDGRFAGRVELPRRTVVMDAQGDRVWAMQRDEDGLPGVVRFRVSPGFAAP